MYIVHNNLERFSFGFLATEDPIYNSIFCTVIEFF
jgi:hypothetical protein